MQELQQMWFLVPGSERCPGGGNGNPLQYSCLENPMDRGAWRATVHRLGKSRTRPVTERAQSLLLCLWLLWVDKMRPGHTHVVARPLGWFTPTAEHSSIVCKYHCLFIPSVEGHPDCFQDLAVMSKAAINIQTQVCLWACVLTSLE